MQHRFLILTLFLSIFINSVSSIAKPIPVTRELREKHAPHTLKGREPSTTTQIAQEKLIDAFLSEDANDTSTTNVHRGVLLRAAKEGNAIGSAINRGSNRLGHALSNVESFHEALLNATKLFASQVNAVVSGEESNSKATISAPGTKYTEEDDAINPWADAIGSALHGGGLATLANGGRKKVQLQQDFDRLAAAPIRALHRDRHRVAHNLAHADRQARKNKDEEKLSKLLAGSALGQEAVTTTLSAVNDIASDVSKNKRLFSTAAFNSPDKEAARLLRSRLYPKETNTVQIKDHSGLALLDLEQVDTRLRKQWDEERRNADERAGRPSFQPPKSGRNAFSTSAPVTVATGIPRVNRKSRDGNTITTVFDATASTQSAEAMVPSARRSSFGAQAYRSPDNASYIPIFSPTRSYCGEGLLALSNDDDTKMSFMCKDFNASATTTTTTTTATPSTTSEVPLPPAEENILSGRVPFSIGDYKYRMTDAQRRTCVVATNDISCVCGSDAQRAQDSNGLQVCFMKSLSCGFSIISPNATCVPPPTSAATPRRIGEGCYVTSRTNPSYEMVVRASCTATGMSNATFQSFGFGMLSSSDTAELLVIARWKGDKEYVAEPNTTSGQDVFDATSDNGNTATTPLVSGLYEALSTNVTLFGYIEANIDNTVNMTIANDLFNDTNFNFYTQWYNFNRLSDQSASNITGINQLDHESLVRIFNGREDIYLNFNLSSIQSDDFFVGGRLYGEVGFEGVVISSTAAVLLLEITDPPKGTYKEPSRPFSAALLAAIIFILLIVGAGLVYWFRGWRERRRAEHDRKIAEQLGSNDKTWK